MSFLFPSLIASVHVKTKELFPSRKFSSQLFYPFAEEKSLKWSTLAPTHTCFVSAGSTARRRRAPLSVVFIPVGVVLTSSGRFLSTFNN